MDGHLRPVRPGGTELGLQAGSLTRHADRGAPRRLGGRSRGIDYSNLRLMHYHGDEVVEMEEADSPHHDAAGHDLERELSWYRRVFRCRSCDDEVVVEAPPTALTEPRQEAEPLH